MDYPELSLFIGGEWRKTSETMPVINPADETVVGALPVARTADMDDALDAAAIGLRVWSRTAPRERSAIITRAARLMQDRIDQIAWSNTLEVGKPLGQSRYEVSRGGDIMEWDAGEGQRLYGRVIPGSTGLRNTMLRQPIGTVAGFSTWNFPVATAVRKISAALSAGCSLLLKAPEETPAGAFHIAKALQDAGLPDGVLNLIYGHPAEISGHLIPQEQIRLVAFTGSTEVGRHLTKLAAEHMKPVVMELGGHAPVIVCDDVDPAKVALLGATRKYRNSGQVCTSPTRFYVAEGNFSTFADEFVARARATTVGNGFAEGIEMGPLANDRRLDAMTALVEDAVSQGAELCTGGRRIGNKGYFFEPTVLANVPDGAKIMTEEPFGPIAVLNPISSLEDGIAKANHSPFGLAAYGFTNSAASVDQMMRELEVGQLSINTFDTSIPETPFGGVKSSGYGREGGEEGLHNYSIIKNVSYQPVI
ncbi:UNVERIFIED_CONTAM: hypothetical protein GTU68_059915 [Idotea baltica]|nr:hypothetical protein [Idotea baltica]